MIDGAPADPCAGQAFSETAQLRVFAVQPKIDLAHAVSYEAFRAHLAGLVEARVMPCLAQDRPNLIVFPESMSLPAMLVGSRGKLSREQTSVIGASVFLLSTYKDVVARYAAQWPDLHDGQKIILALTDTVWRAVIEPTREIAKRTRAWVVTSAWLSGQVDRSTAAEELAVFADPDLPGVDHVFVARAREVYNTAFVFSPAGEIVARRHKSYLVPTEEGLLELAAGAPADVQPVDLGFARLGLPTCKDGWMPDVVDRLAILGADLLVQPVAFQGWAVPECDDPPCTIEGAQEPAGSWGPDVVKQSAWLAVQKHGALRSGVIAQWTGNALDMVLDGQSAIFADGAAGQRAAGYIGQPASGGFVNVAPWVEPDPGLADQQLSLQQRRDKLRQVGVSLLPGGARENAYVETVVAADIDPSRFVGSAAGAPGALGASAALAPADKGEQSYAALAADGAGAVLVAWQDTRDGRAQVYLAGSGDGGASFGTARAIAPSANAQHTPALLIADGLVHAAWQEVAADERRILSATSADGGATFGPPQDLGTASPADEWLPAFAAAGGKNYLAFAASSAGNVRVQVARSSSAAPQHWQLVAADGAPPVRDAPNVRNNQWAPAIVADGSSVHVAWVDYRNYNWDVFLARSGDSGATFEPAKRVDDGTDHYERIHDDATLALTADGTLLCGWSDVRLRQPAATARVMRLAGSGVKSQLLAGDEQQTSAWRPRLAIGADNTVLAAWQALGTMTNEIYLARSSDGGQTFAAGVRVDDGEHGAGQQLAPRLAWTGGRQALVLWEDSRAGRRQIRFVVGTP